MNQANQTNSTAQTTDVLADLRSQHEQRNELTWEQKMIQALYEDNRRLNGSLNQAEAVKRELSEELQELRNQVKDRDIRTCVARCLRVARGALGTCEDAGKVAQQVEDILLLIQRRDMGDVSNREFKTQIESYLR